MRNKKNTLKVARWLAKEYAGYSPAARGRKIRETLGDSKAARSFVRRMLPDCYEDAYGSAPSTTLGTRALTTSGKSSAATASGRSAASRSELLHAKSR